jgi:hypothetical protein
MKSRPITTKTMKLSAKSGKDGTGMPLSSQIGDEISKNRYTGHQEGMKLSLAANVVLN